MQLVAVGFSGARSVLAGAVEVVPCGLVGNQQPEQAQVAVSGQSPEQRGTVRVGALMRDRVECVSADRRVGSGLGAAAPCIDLTSDRPQSPYELACGDGGKCCDLSGTQRPRVFGLFTYG